MTFELINKANRLKENYENAVDLSEATKGYNITITSTNGQMATNTVNLDDDELKSLIYEACMKRASELLKEIENL